MSGERRQVTKEPIWPAKGKGRSRSLTAIRARRGWVRDDNKNRCKSRSFGTTNSCLRMTAKTVSTFAVEDEVGDGEKGAAEFGIFQDGEAFFSASGVFDGEAAGMFESARVADE